MEYLKHPIIAGLIACGLSFLCLKIKYKRESNDGEDFTIEKPSLKYPILLGIIIFIGLSIFNNSNNQNNVKQLYIPSQVEIIKSSSLSIPKNIKMLGDVLPPIFLKTQ